MPITDALTALNSLSKKQAMITIGNYVKGKADPYFIEAIIIQLESVKAGENPDFISRTP